MSDSVEKVIDRYLADIQKRLEKAEWQAESIHDMVFEQNREWDNIKHLQEESKNIQRMISACIVDLTTAREDIWIEVRDATGFYTEEEEVR